MENKEVAKVFQKISDLLEIQEGNPFRIRSFQRAAQLIGDLSMDVSKLAEESPETLLEISGIGEGTVGKIREIAETGTCAELVELEKKIPASLLDLLKVQGLGPKKVKVLWKKLGITDVDRLEAAAKAERIRRLAGFGEKTELNILKSIDAYRRRQGRSRLDVALEVAESIVEHIRSECGITQVEPAGSLRRRRETIGDIDILAASTDPAKVGRAFVEHPEVAEIILQGDTKTSVRLKNGQSCDLRIVEPDSFGAALQYFTGSKEHNVVLRERAKRLGYKINEYGLFRSEDGKRVAGEDEETIYKLLKLHCMPPEMREDRGEIEAAEKELPRIVDLPDLQGDLHLHTTDSDGRDPLEDMVRGAKARGYRYLAITDHSKALAMVGGLDEEKVMQQVERIRKLKESEPGLEVLTGIEVDILEDGRLDLSDEVLEQLDVVIASVHSHFEQDGKTMTRRICRAIENPHVNILGHPTGRLINQRDAYEIDLDQVFKLARENRVCLEISSLPKRLDLTDVNSKAAQEAGCLLTINTDAHSVKGLDAIRYGVWTGRRGWLRPENVINTYSLSKLRKVLKKQEYR